METIGKLLDNKTVVVCYFAVLLVLVLLIAYILFKTSSSMSKSEKLIGGPVDSQIFAGAPNLRSQGTEFSSTNQGDVTTVSNVNLKANVPGVIPAKGSNSNSERLVSERGDPDFWEISAELNAYKEAQVSPMMSAATTDPSGTGTSIDPTTGTVSSGTTERMVRERLASNSVASIVEDQLLQNQLWHA